MKILIPEYPDPFIPGSHIVAGGWASVVQVGPLDGSAWVSFPLWINEAAYAEGAQPFAHEEYAPGNGLPTLAELMADPKFLLGWALIGSVVHELAAARFAGASVVYDNNEQAILDAAAPLVAAISGGGQ